VNLFSRLLSIFCVLAFGWHLARGQAQPQVFAPGVVSGGAVFGLAFTPDGNTVYFCETDPEIKHIQIMESHRIKGKWRKPAPAPFSPDPYRDIDPFITLDGRHLFFNSNRPADGKGEALKTFDIFVMDRLPSGQWSMPKAVANANSPANEVFVSVARNGNLYFSSNREGGKGKNDIYFSRKTAKGYEPPRLLDGIDSEDTEDNPLIAPDESFLIFARHVNEHNDLFVSYREGEHWTAPESLGPLVNTDNDEYAPAFSSDHKLLYFTRTRFENGKRMKPGTIYSVRLSELKMGISERFRKKWR
jgi:Tol biopolymer transport system component